MSSDFTNDMPNRGKQSVRYKYDALGRRVQRYLVGNRENTKFIYEGQDVLADDNAGTLTKYLNGPGIDNKLRQTTGSSTSYFLADHLGSTNGLTDQTGLLTSSNSYDSFGNPTNSSFPTRYQFTGREYDSFTSLQYNRARFYDPKLGRFISEDPIGFTGGDINLYGYVRNRPTLYTDPLGRFPMWRLDSVYDKGWRAESENFPNGAPDGSADPYGGAYRHCVATCYLKRRYGPLGTLARRLWDWYHEDPNDANSRGDMCGEDFGEAVATYEGKTCEEGCLEKYPNK